MITYIYEQIQKDANISKDFKLALKGGDENGSKKNVKSK